MFKINATELHISIQKKLSKLVDGKLTKEGVITTAVDPDCLNWEELELEIYGSIDSDADRLFESISWGEPEITVDALKATIEANFTNLNDWYKYQCNGADFALFNNSTIIGAVGYYTYGLDPKYCGESFTATGKTKQVTEYEQLDGFGFADSVNESTFTKYQYQHQDGTTLWAGNNFTQILSEQEVVKGIQNDIHAYCQREKLTWEQLVASIDARKARNEQERLDKITAEEAAKSNVAEPEWFKKEIWSKSLTSFWVGESKYSFFWNEKDGTVWQECDDRTNGLANRTRTTESIGSDRETVLAVIHKLLVAKEAKTAQRKELESQKKERETAYEAYKKVQQAKRGLVKSFEKWLASVQPT